MGWVMRVLYSTTYFNALEPKSTTWLHGGAACRIRIQCNGSTGTVCDISVRIFVAKKRRLALRNDPTKARRQLFASGATNFPAGQIANVKLGLRKAGKLTARTSKRSRIRGVMEITSSIGAVSSTPIRIRLP